MERYIYKLKGFNFYKKLILYENIELEVQLQIALKIGMSCKYICLFKHWID